jgi:putative tryptophan/tyrosine transport system substrate-binding protein
MCAGLEAILNAAGNMQPNLREAVPGLRRLAILFDAGYPAPLKESSEAEATARATGLEIMLLGIRRTDEIAPAFGALKVDALYVVDNALVTANRTLIIALAVGMRLPTAF